jgi:hypothetical protein
MSARHVTGEARLVTSIFVLAFRDAFGPASHPWCSDTIAARRFLTDAKGEHAASRAAWCDVLGADPEAIREAAQRDAADFDAWYAAGRPEGSKPRWCTRAARKGGADLDG